MYKKIIFFIIFILSIVSVVADYRGIWFGTGTAALSGNIYQTNGNTTVYLKYDGNEEIITSMSSLDGVPYGGQGSGSGDGDIFRYNGSIFSKIYDGGYYSVMGMVAYKGYMYASMSGGANQGDVLRCNSTTCTLAYNGSTSDLRGITVCNNKLYVGEYGAKLIEFNGSAWSQKCDLAEEYMFTVACFNNTVFMGVGLAANQGDMYRYSAGSCTKFHDTVRPALLSLYPFGDRIYAGFGYSISNGDIDYCFYNGTCIGNDFAGSQEYINILGSYDGKVYAGQGVSVGDGDIYRKNSTTSPWYLYYNGALGTIYSMIGIENSTALYPPTKPYIYSPIQNTSYHKQVYIDHSISTTPSGFITYYNLSLLNPNRTFNRTIIGNNSNKTKYMWNITTKTSGNFYINVTVYNSVGLKISNTSKNFTVHYVPNINITVNDINNTHGKHDLKTFYDVDSHDTYYPMYCIVKSNIGDNFSTPLDFNVSGSFNVSFEGSDMLYKYYIICMDGYASNRSYNYTYVKDSTKPNINILSPLDHSLMISDIDLSIDANDTYLLRIFGNVTDILGNILFNFSYSPITDHIHYNLTIDTTNYTSGFYNINVADCDTDGFGSCLNINKTYITLNINSILNWSYPTNNTIINYHTNTTPKIFYLKNYVTDCVFNSSVYSIDLSSIVGNNNISVGHPIGNYDYNLSCAFLSITKNLTYCNYSLSCIDGSDVCLSGKKYCINISILGNCSYVNTSSFSIYQGECETTELIYGRCPSNIPSVTLLFLFMIVGVTMILTGIVLSSGVFVGTGSCIIFFMGFIVLSCSTPIGIAIILFSILGVAIGFTGAIR
jgi:hypothetical protein